VAPARILAGGEINIQAHISLQRPDDGRHRGVIHRRPGVNQDSPE